MGAQMREGAEDCLWEEGVSDLEMVKACAEAMGLRLKLDDCGSYYDEEGSVRVYWPLGKDAQAMALVKRFKLRSICVNGSDNWSVSRGFLESAMNPDLNRAIVECVAKLQSKARQV